MTAPDGHPAEPAAGRPGPMPDWAGPVVLDAPPWLLRELRERLDTGRTGT